MLYIGVGITLLAGLLVGISNIWLDIIIIFTMAVVLQLKKSRVCSIVLLLYALLNTIIFFIINGKAGGYLYIIAAIYAIPNTFKYQKAWENYKRTGMLP